MANDLYAERVKQIVEAARHGTTGTGNDFYRTLQLLTHLSRSPLVDPPKPTHKLVSEAVAELAAAGPIIPWAELVKVHRKNQYLDHGTWFGVGEPLWHLDPEDNRRLVVFTLRRGIA